MSIYAFLAQLALASYKQQLYKMSLQGCDIYSM